MLSGILSNEFLSTKGRRESKSDHSFFLSFFQLKIRDLRDPQPKNHSPRLGIAEGGGVWGGLVMLEKDELGAETKASKQSERSLERGEGGGGPGSREQDTEKGLGERLNKLFACAV